MIYFEPRELRHSMMLHQVPIIRDQALGCKDGTGKSPTSRKVHSKHAESACTCGDFPR